MDQRRIGSDKRRNHAKRIQDRDDRRFHYLGSRSAPERKIKYARPAGAFVLESVAHSGAVIGATGVSGTPQVGEVPASRLSIIEQCDGYGNSPDTVDLVIMNGGINDVGVATILNPLALIPPLEVRVTRACHDAMLVLLNNVSAKFSRRSNRGQHTYYSVLRLDQASSRE
jgi:hypothetical protein